ALIQAASGDPEDDVRDEARDALKAIGRRCVVECQACGPPRAGQVVRRSQPIPPDRLPILAPGQGAFSRAPAPDSGAAPEVIPPSTRPRALPDPDVPPPPPTPYNVPATSRAGAGARPR